MLAIGIVDELSARHTSGVQAWIVERAVFAAVDREDVLIDNGQAGKRCDLQISKAVRLVELYGDM